MRGWALIFVAACGFTPSGASPGADGSTASPDASPRGSDGSLVTTDAGSSVGSACGGELWVADFRGDPTVGGRWLLRDGSVFPVDQLQDGVWAAPVLSEPLDTQPKQLFDTRTVIHVSMRATGIGTGILGGAVFWINAGYTAGSDTFSPLFVNLSFDGTSQDLTLYTKDDDIDAVELTSASDLGSGMLDLTLDVDPVGHTVHFIGGGQDQPGLALGIIESASTDQWATIQAVGASSEFQSVSVEVCP